MDDSPRYCDHCGRLLAGTEGEHDREACRARLALEPPRYCPRCGRRTVVKVTPHGWSSQCSRHGLTAGTA